MSDSWLLTQATFRMARRNPALLWIPTAAAAGGAAVVAGEMFGLAWLASTDSGFSGWALGTPGGIASLALLALGTYLLVTFATVCCIGGVIASTVLMLQGRPDGVRAGFAVVRSRLGRMLAWSLIVASIGLLVGAASRQLGGTGGRILRIGVDISWGLATYFVLPVLLFEEEPLLRSIPRSAELYFNRFGQNFVPNLLLGFIALVIGMGAALLWLQGLSAGEAGAPGWTPWLYLIPGAALLVFDFVLVSGVGAIMQAALYRMAVSGRDVEGTLDRVYGHPHLW